MLQTAEEIESEEKALKRAGMIRPITKQAIVRERADGSFVITDMNIMLVVYPDGEVVDLTNV